MSCIKLGFVFGIILSAASFSQAAVSQVAQLSGEMKGSTVTLTGRVSGWRDSWKDTAPNTFYVQDVTGSVRTCIWPNQLSKTPPNVAAALKVAGTAVRVTGSVKEFQKKMEIHVGKGADIVLVPEAFTAVNTSATEAVAAPR